MKILHIAEAVAGGVASYLEETVPWQAAQLGSGNVRVLVPADQARHLAGLPDGTVATFAPSRRTLRDLVRLGRSAREAIRRHRPDVVHLHSSFAGAVVRSLSFLAPAASPKIVYCAHGWSFDMQARPFRTGFYAWVERRLQRATDLVVCISDDDYESALRRGLDRGKLVAIPNGIARDAPGPGPRPALDRAKLNLLFVGRFAPQKGLPTLLGAMERLAGAPVHLHVVGADVASRSDAGAVPARGNVTFHGWQPRQRVHDYMAACDALVVPSQWEGFGLVALEAMRLGRAVLASRVGALPELVEEGSSGLLFEAGDATGLAELIASLDRRRLEAFGQAGRERFLGRFTAEEMNRRLLDAYRRVTACDG